MSTITSQSQATSLSYDTLNDLEGYSIDGRSVHGDGGEGSSNGKHLKSPRGKGKSKKNKNSAVSRNKKGNLSADNVMETEDDESSMMSSVLSSSSSSFTPKKVKKTQNGVSKSLEKRLNKSNKKLKDEIVEVIKIDIDRDQLQECTLISFSGAERGVMTYVVRKWLCQKIERLIIKKNNFLKKLAKSGFDLIESLQGYEEFGEEDVVEGRVCGGLMVTQGCGGMMVKRIRQGVVDGKIKYDWLRENVEATNETLESISATLKQVSRTSSPKKAFQKRGNDLANNATIIPRSPRKVKSPNPTSFNQSTLNNNNNNNNNNNSNIFNNDKNTHNNNNNINIKPIDNNLRSFNNNKPVTKNINNFPSTYKMNNNNKNIANNNKITKVDDIITDNESLRLNVGTNSKMFSAISVNDIINDFDNKLNFNAAPQFNTYQHNGTTKHNNNNNNQNNNNHHQNNNNNININNNNNNFLNNNIISKHPFVQQTQNQNVISRDNNNNNNNNNNTDNTDYYEDDSFDDVSSDDASSYHNNHDSTLRYHGNNANGWVGNNNNTSVSFQANTDNNNNKNNFNFNTNNINNNNFNINNNNMVNVNSGVNPGQQNALNNNTSNEYNNGNGYGEDEKEEEEEEEDDGGMDGSLGAGGFVEVVLQTTKTKGDWVVLEGGNVVGVVVKRCSTEWCEAGLRELDEVVQVGGARVDGKTKEAVYAMLGKTVGDAKRMKVRRECLGRVSDILNKVKSQGGDRFFVEANFDFEEESKDWKDGASVDSGYAGSGGDGKKDVLSFKKGDKFCVTDSKPEKTEGWWRVVRADFRPGAQSAKSSAKHHLNEGFIPNKSNATRFITHKHLLSSHKRSGTLMRSFRKHKTSPSTITDVMPYHPVMLAPTNHKRPVFISGLFSDSICRRLIADSPGLYEIPLRVVEINQLTPPTTTNGATIPRVDVTALQEIMLKNKHPVCCVSPPGLDYLKHHTDLDPILLLMSAPTKSVVKEVARQLKGPQTQLQWSSLLEESGKFEKKNAFLFDARLSFTPDFSWFSVLKDTVNKLQVIPRWKRVELIDEDDDNDDDARLRADNDHDSFIPLNKRISKTTDDLPQAPLKSNFKKDPKPTDGINSAPSLVNLFSSHVITPKKGRIQFRF